MRRIIALILMLVSLPTLLPGPVSAVTGGCGDPSCDAHDINTGQGLDQLVPPASLPGLYANRYTVRSLMFRWVYPTLSNPIGWTLSTVGMVTVMLRTWLVKIAASLMVNAFTVDFDSIFKPQAKYFSFAFMQQFYFPNLPWFMLFTAAFCVAALLTLQLRRFFMTITMLFVMLLAGLFVASRLPDVVEELDKSIQQAALQVLAFGQPGVDAQTALVGADNAIFMHYAIDWACIEEFGDMKTCWKYQQDGVPGAQLWSKNWEEGYQWLSANGGSSNPDFQWIYDPHMAWERMGESLVALVICLVAVAIMVLLACSVIFLKAMTWIWVIASVVTALAALWPGNGYLLLKRTVERAIGAILAQFLLAFAFAVLMLLTATIFAHGDALPGKWLGAGLDVCIIYVGLYVYRNQLFSLFILRSSNPIVQMGAGTWLSASNVATAAAVDAGTWGRQTIGRLQEAHHQGQLRDIAGMMEDQHAMRSPLAARRQQRMMLQYGVRHDPNRIEADVTKLERLESQGIDPRRVLNRAPMHASDADQVQAVNQRHHERLGRFRAEQDQVFEDLRRWGSAGRPAPREVRNAQWIHRIKLGYEGERLAGREPPAPSGQTPGRRKKRANP